jgi:hypothetical protein
MFNGQKMPYGTIISLEMEQRLQILKMEAKYILFTAPTAIALLSKGLEFRTCALGNLSL